MTALSTNSALGRFSLSLPLATWILLCWVSFWDGWDGIEDVFRFHAHPSSANAPMYRANVRSPNQKKMPPLMV